LPINQHTFGLCGLIGCSTSLVNSLCKGSNIKKPTSYDRKSAQKSNQYSPCTNCPVKCDVCDGIYWSYNLECHFNENHKLYVKVSVSNRSKYSTDLQLSDINFRTLENEKTPVVAVTEKLVTFSSPKIESYGQSLKN
jgi:hypothetical protein